MELFSSPRRVTGGDRARERSTTPAASGRCSWIAALDVGVPLTRDLATRPARRSTASSTRVSSPANPLDAWGTGHDADRIFRDSPPRAARRSRGRRAWRSWSISRGRASPTTRATSRSRATCSRRSTKPFCVLSNLASAVALRGGALSCATRASPCSRAPRPGWWRSAHLLRAPRRTGAPGRRRRRRRSPTRCAPGGANAWRPASEVGELEGLALLADYGVPVVEARAASSADDAVAAADRDRLPGRAEDRGARRAAQVGRRRREGSGSSTVTRCAPRTRTWPAGSVRRSRSGRWRPRASRSRSASCGTPRSARSCSWRPAGSSSSCCTTARWRSRRSTRPARARLVDRLKIRPLLDGVRGAEPSDVDALVRAISRLSVLAADLGDLLERPRREPGDRLAERLRRGRRARDPGDVLVGGLVPGGPRQPSSSSSAYGSNAFVQGLPGATHRVRFATSATIPNMIALDSGPSAGSGCTQMSCPSAP